MGVAFGARCAKIQKKRTFTISAIMMMIRMCDVIVNGQRTYSTVTVALDSNKSGMNV